jgi:hypothetical protein
MLMTEESQETQAIHKLNLILASAPVSLPAIRLVRADVTAKNVLQLPRSCLAKTNKSPSALRGPMAC